MVGVLCFSHFPRKFQFVKGGVRPNMVNLKSACQRNPSFYKTCIRQCLVIRLRVPLATKAIHKKAIIRSRSCPMYLQSGAFDIACLSQGNETSWSEFVFFFLMIIMNYGGNLYRTYDT